MRKSRPACALLTSAPSILLPNSYFPALNAVNGAPVMGYTLNQANNAFLNVLEDGFTIANAPNGMVASRHLHGALVFKATTSSYVGQVFTIDTMNSTT